MRGIAANAIGRPLQNHEGAVGMVKWLWRCSVEALVELDESAKPAW
jgi:hypothetical protein